MRTLMIAALAGWTFVGISMAARGEAPESKELAAQRERMVNRTRRIIYNNDGCDAFGNARTPEAFLGQRMTAVPNTQVDSVFYCTGATVMFTHDAKVGETYGKYPVTGSWGQGIGQNCAALIAGGKDTLSLVVEFCKRHDLEVFFTHRINDIHDSLPSGSFELATWKRQHPEYLLGKQADQGKYKGSDPRYWWSALDFEIPEVRDYLIAIVQDVCRRYDIDGYEIDYFRSPMFFRPNLEYKPATIGQMNLLTEFQRRVRETAYREGNRRGRPILVSVRVPMTVQKCRHVGIDIKRWLKEDLFDLLTTGGGYVPFTMPTRELVELGHKYGKPVYPTISASGLRRRFRGIKAWRGAAMNAWSNGADGIVLFNTFPSTPGHPHFTELGDPKAMRFANKLFAIDNHRVTEGDLAQAIPQDGILPIEVLPGQAARALLPVGDDIPAAAQAGRLDETLLRVRCAGLASGRALAVRVNRTPAERLDPARMPMTVPGRIGRAMKFDGSIVLSAGNDRSLQITEGDFSFSMWIKTRQKESWSGFVVFVDPPHKTGVKLYWNGGTLNFSLRRQGEDNWNVPGGQIVGDGRWHHYAATFDRDGGAIAYVDGKVVGTRDIADRQGSLGTDKVLMIGTGDVPYEGLIDDLRLYDRVLNEKEISRIINGDEGTVAKANLRGWWKFDEAAGDTFADSSRNRNAARPKQDKPGGTWIIYRPQPGSLRRGRNELSFRAPRQGPQAEPIRITDVELHVGYKHE